MRICVLLAKVEAELPFVPAISSWWFPSAAGATAGRSRVFFPGGRPRPRLIRGACSEITFRGRPRGRLTDAAAFTPRVFFTRDFDFALPRVFAFGGRPRFALGGRPGRFGFCLTGRPRGLV